MLPFDEMMLLLNFEKIGLPKQLIIVNKRDRKNLRAVSSEIALLKLSFRGMGFFNDFFKCCIQHYHSRFSQSLSLKKLLQQRYWYFSIPNDRKRSWENFEGMFPELFFKIFAYKWENGKNDQISYFYLEFWFKIEFFEV